MGKGSFHSQTSVMRCQTTRFECFYDLKNVLSLSPPFLLMQFILKHASYCCPSLLQPFPLPLLNATPCSAACLPAWLPAALANNETLGQVQHTQTQQAKVVLWQVSPQRRSKVGQA